MNKKKGKAKYSTKLKRKISTMQLGRVYYDEVIDNKKKMFGE